MSKIAVGCSHTYGVGLLDCWPIALEPSKFAWPNLLGAINCGVPGASSDLISRTMPVLLRKYQPDTVYVLWPDWTRFEYLKNGIYYQSMPTDANRIHFMEMATDEWLHANFKQQQTTVRNLCKDIRLIELTLDELILYIDHADKWPPAADGCHFNSEWHRWVADIFNGKT